MNIHTGTLSYECTDMYIHTGTLAYECIVARIRGRGGRIRRSDAGHEDFLQRQAEQQDEEYMPG
ncbi:hypothetical protein A2U01_0050102, partial [Trifolium medium]|nr:hypothetical protein [Trifolium medium]